MKNILNWIRKRIVKTEFYYDRKRMYWRYRKSDRILNCLNWICESTVSSDNFILKEVYWQADDLRTYLINKK